LPYASTVKLATSPCYSIVDDDRHAPFDIDRLSRAEIETPTALDLGEFTLLSRFEIAARRLNHAHYLLVDDNLRTKAVDDGAEGKFLVPWRADLAHQKKVQRCPKVPSDLKADWHAASRQSQHERIGTLEAFQRPGQLSPSITPVIEHHVEISARGRCARNHREA
jgi:hypothetical protein